jgi:hypothetical protein
MGLFIRPVDLRAGMGSHAFELNLRRPGRGFWRARFSKVAHIPLAAEVRRPVKTADWRGCDRLMQIAG